MDSKETLKQPLVMIIDDDMTMRYLVAEALEEAGFRIEEVDDGSAAVDACRRLRPDIILLDVIMPGMDGFTVCRSLRSLPEGEHTPILMMTGLDDVNSINRAYEVGATDFITKPLNYAILSHRLRYMLRARKTLERLRSSEQRLAEAQQIAHLGNWQFDLEQRSLQLSDELLSILGINRQNFDISYKNILRLIHPEDRRLLATTLKDTLLNNTPFSIEHKIILPDKTARIIHQEAKITSNSTTGKQRLTGTVQDITERKKVEQKIFYLAYYDELTGLPNRSFFKHYLAQGINQAKRYNRKLAILCIDLDNFKHINDTLGHTVGDLVLKETANRLKGDSKNIDFVTRRIPESSRIAFKHRGGDALTRLDGNEFGLLLTEVRQAEDAALVAQRVKEALSSPLNLAGNEIFISASMGIVVYPNDGEIVDELLKNAASAMHHAKECGKNNYQFFTESINEKAYERLSLANKLHGALEREELYLLYQPKIDIQKHQIVGFEALVRWQHPVLGLVPPDRFIPVAEETGLIAPLGEWVLRTACLQNKRWQEAGYPHLQIAVNVSARQFNGDILVDTVNKILNETGLDPHSLELELTEGVLMENTEITSAVLSRLKALGVDIALDDFGTGYSSLSYLNSFPIDVIKIDQSFARNLTVDRNSGAIALAIIALSRSLNLKVVAEGVELEPQLDFMRRHGCNLIQGYYFSPPISADKAGVLLKNFSFENKLKAAL